MTEQLTSPPAGPGSGGEPDAYEVLGISPRAEDVVVRAAYRSLLNKYTTAGRIPHDPEGDDRKIGEVQAAYDLVKEPSLRRAYDERRGLFLAPPPTPIRPSAAPPVPPRVTPAIVGPVRPPAAPRGRPPAWAFALGGAGLTVVALVAVVMSRRPTVTAAPAGVAALSVQPQTPQSLPVAAARPLPCYVDGRSVGSLPLADCAARNGVATGPLDVGLTAAAEPPKSGPKAKPTAPPPEAQPQALAAAAAPASPAVLSPLAPPPPAPRGAGDAPSQAPTSTPVAASQPNLPQSMATVRAFYEALGDGDGVRAASLVEPEKRQQGPLSAARMTRFYGSLQAPLRITRIQPLDPSTIYVRYQFVAADGRVCSGAANVTTARRDDQVLVRGIRAFNGC